MCKGKSNFWRILLGWSKEYAIPLNFKSCPVTLNSAERHVLQLEFLHASPSYFSTLIAQHHILVFLCSRVLFYVLFHCLGFILWFYWFSFAASFFMSINDKLQTRKVLKMSHLIFTFKYWKVLKNVTPWSSLIDWLVRLKSCCRKLHLIIFLPIYYCGSGWKVLCFHIRLSWASS